jgi:hypothetical protein
MRHPKIKVYSLALLIVILAVFVPTALAGGNDFVVGVLRVDLSEVTTGQYLDYRHYVYNSAAPNNQTSDYTAGWFGIDLAQFNGQPYSAQFTQVGVITQQSEGRWFVYAEPGVVCWRGTPAWVGGDGITRGCIGNFGDLSTTPGDGTWTRVELVTYSGQSWWIGRVYNADNQAYDVAKVSSGSKRIYYAQASSEEAYIGAVDPHILMSFYHYHPEYWKPGVGFTLWPQSSGGHNNFLYTTPEGICPEWYGAQSGIQGNPHLWRTASGDEECSVNPLF